MDHAAVLGGPMVGQGAPSLKAFLAHGALKAHPFQVGLHVPAHVLPGALHLGANRTLESRPRPRRNGEDHRVHRVVQVCACRDKNGRKEIEKKTISQRTAQFL